MELSKRPHPPLQPGHRQPVWRLTLLWLGISSLIGAFLINRLADQIHPWDHVLHIPNGITDNPMVGHWIHPDFRFLSVSPDDQTFAFGRPNGDAEIWDLNQLKRVATLDLPDPESPPDPEHPIGTSPTHFQHSENGNLFVHSSGHGIFEFSPIGELIQHHKIPDKHLSEVNVSPNGHYIAYITSSPQIFDCREGQILSIPGLDQETYSRKSCNWTPDGLHVLFKDGASHSVVNLADLTVNSQPDQSNGIHLETHFVMNGSRFASIYTSDILSNSDSPQQRKFTLFDTQSGHGLVEQSLPEDPRTLLVTKSGLILILMVEDFENLIYLYDSRSGKKTGKMSFKLVNNFPPKIEISPDQKHLLVASNQSWLVDFDDIAAPVKLKNHPSNTLMGQFASDGKTLVTLQINLDVDVWKQRRELSRFGAMVRWEYWGTKLIGVLCFVGIVVQVGSRTQRQSGRRLPFLFWCAVLTLAAGTGLQLVNILMDPILDRVWKTDSDLQIGRTIWKALGVILWFRILIGLVRLELVWRKVALTLITIALILLVGVISWFGWFVTQIPADILQEALDKLVLTNGWKPNASLGEIFIVIALPVTSLAAIWWVLFRQPTKALFVTHTNPSPVPIFNP